MLSCEGENKSYLADEGGVLGGGEVDGHDDVLVLVHGVDDELLASFVPLEY